MLWKSGSGLGEMSGAGSRISWSIGPVKRRLLTLVCGMALATILGLGMASSAQAMPVQFFYVPLPEDQLLTFFTAVENGGPSNAPTEPITSYITITAVADNTIIYYDQWENGYDIDIANTLDIYSAANLDGTQIWGDGNTVNGAPPGIPSDLIDSGTLINLNNNVVTTTRQSVIDFDGGDKIAATKTIALTRTSWAAGLGPFLPDASRCSTPTTGEPTTAPRWARTSPTAPTTRCSSTPPSRSWPAKTAPTVQIDADADGTFETTLTLDEGDSTYVSRRCQWAAMWSPAQPGAGGHLDRRHRLQLREPRLGPHTDQHVVKPLLHSCLDAARVPRADARTTVWLYNPGTSAISVTYQRRNTSGVRVTSTVSVPAGGVCQADTRDATDGTGSCFYSSGATFYAFSTTDSAQRDLYGNNQAWDWGYHDDPQYHADDAGAGRPGSSVAIRLLPPTPPRTATRSGSPRSATVTPRPQCMSTTTPIRRPVRLTDPSGDKYDASYSLRELDQARVYVRGPGGRRDQPG